MVGRTAASSKGAPKILEELKDDMISSCEENRKFCSYCCA